MAITRLNTHLIRRRKFNYKEYNCECKDYYSRTFLDSYNKSKGMIIVFCHRIDPKTKKRETWTAPEIEYWFDGKIKETLNVPKTAREFDGILKRLDLIPKDLEVNKRF